MVQAEVSRDGGCLWLELADMKPLLLKKCSGLPATCVCASLKLPSLNQPSCTPPLHGPGNCCRCCRWSRGNSYCAPHTVPVMQSIPSPGALLGAGYLS